jgi:hypothetical protein
MILFLFLTVNEPFGWKERGYPISLRTQLRPDLLDASGFILKYLVSLDGRSRACQNMQV